ncbi:hypothetical protein IWW46_005575 [Coemansia sp. RSA 2440]|nr:hypothetical protein IWW46_005575 [Coemansia sp. RSA 2440]
MRRIPNQFQILHRKVLKVFRSPLNNQFREWTWLTLQLHFKSIHMVRVYMRISHAMNKVSGLQPCNMSNKPGQQRIRRNVEWHAQAHVARSLVHLARERGVWRVWVGHKKLGKHMTRRKRHRMQVSRVPRAHNNPPVSRILPYLANNILQLVHALARIIVVSIHIRSTEMPPLEPIHRA